MTKKYHQTIEALIRQVRPGEKSKAAWCHQFCSPELSRFMPDQIHYTIYE